MDIKEMASYLKLSYIRDHYDLLVDEATHLDLSHGLLELLLQREVEKRRQNGIARRIRKAKFLSNTILKILKKINMNQGLGISLKSLKAWTLSKKGEHYSDGYFWLWKDSLRHSIRH